MRRRMKLNCKDGPSQWVTYLGWVLDELPSKPNKITPTHTSTPSLDLAVLEEQEVLHGDLKRRDEFDSVGTSHGNDVAMSDVPKNVHPAGLEVQSRPSQ
nr:uncharacterized protein LOC109146685 [Ipomoea batatas]